MRTYLLWFLLLLTGLGCQTEQIAIATNANDVFYVDQGASLRVQVRGSTRSNKIILTVHGGPVGSAYFLSHLRYMQQWVEPKYAVAYLDQPMAETSQDNRIDYSLDDISGSIGKAVPC